MGVAEFIKYKVMKINHTFKSFKKFERLTFLLKKVVPSYINGKNIINHKN